MAAYTDGALAITTTVFSSAPSNKALPNVLQSHPSTKIVIIASPL